MSSPEWVQTKKDEIEEIISRYPESRSALMPLLHLAQDEKGHVSDEDMAAIAEILNLTKAYVESVCSFYTLYHRQPMGKYVITVCGNIVCGISGAAALTTYLEEKLGIKVGEMTDDGLISLIVTGECVAGCDGAPCIQVNLEYCGDVTFERADEIIDMIRAGKSAVEISDRFGIAPVKVLED